MQIHRSPARSGLASSAACLHRGAALAVLALGALAAGAGDGRAPAEPAGYAFRFGDYDGDGRLDVYVAGAGPDQLLRNLGDGRFGDVTESAGLAGLSDSALAVWQDVDGDQDLDLFVVSAAGAPRLLENCGSACFADATAGLGRVASAALAARWLDVDGDGLADLHLATEEGDVLLYNRGRLAFERAELPHYAAPTPPSGGTLESSVPGGAGFGSASGLGGGTTTASSGICAASITDQATSLCIDASSIPLLGTLYPLSNDFNVSAAGDVGIGTAAPGQKLDVAGNIRSSGRLILTTTSAQPIGVSSTVKCDNLNADLLDGLDAGAFTQLGQSIEGSEISDASVAPADLATDPASLAHVSGGAMTSTSGRIGVGTFSPAEALDVNGNVRSSGAFLTSSSILELYANGLRVYRAIADAVSPGVVSGSTSNLYFVGVKGGTISGGGEAGLMNVVSDDYGTVGGGRANQAGNIGGATGDAPFTTVGGGVQNAATADRATISGGSGNQASAANATVCGGRANIASGTDAIVLGGFLNLASGANSLAGGQRAKAQNQGAFVWADSTAADFASTGTDQFLIRATGGVGIGTTGPEAPLHVFEGSAGTVTANSGSSAVFERSAQNYVTLLSPATSESGLLFGIPTNSADGGIVYNNTADARGLQFRTGGNFTRMVLTSAGDLGVGTTAPAADLQVVGSATLGSMMISPNEPSFNQSSEIVLAENTSGSFGFVMHMDGNLNELQIHHIGQTASGGIVLTDTVGQMGLGRSPTANSLEVAGNASKSTAGSWLANSDRRIKTGIRPVEGALDTLERVRPVTFHYTEEYRRTHPEIADVEYYNVIAQEFAEVFPDYVKSSGEGDILQVDTYPMLITAVAAVRELRGAVRRQDTRVAELEAALADLRGEVQALAARR